MDLPIIWYVVMGFSILAYSILDGFDLGVGALHLFARTDEQRRIFLNAIGPVWDGNEVWIVVVMGGMFAGFPNAYATVFSGFYNLLMILIAGLIFRACAIEFRSKHESKAWRYTWDAVFSFASVVVAFVLGVLLGNMIEGIPLNEKQNYTGTFSLFFRPYSVIVGFTAVALFAMHGAIYLTMKTEGAAHAIVRRWINGAILSFVFWYAMTTVATIVYMPHMFQRIIDNPYYCIFPILGLLAIANIPLQIKKKNDGWAFISSSLAIAFLLLLFSLGTFPYIVRSTIETNSVTIYNAASSAKTLKVLLIVVMIGVPLILAYCGWAYRIFRGKVRLGKSSY